MAMRRRQRDLVWLTMLFTILARRARSFSAASRAPSLFTITDNAASAHHKRTFFGTATNRAAAAAASSSRHHSAAATTTSDTEKEPVLKIPRKFVPHPFPYHHELTLKVASLTNLGFGVCRTPLLPRDYDNASEEEEKEEPTGTEEEAAQANRKKEWVIMVPNVIPGETVKVRIYRNYKTYSDADLVQVLEQSPHRVEPKCVLSQVCGGCQYQHMDIDVQRQWKHEQVTEALQRVAKLEPVPLVAPTLGTEHTYHYRSKLTPHYDAPGKSKDITAIGFKEKASRRIVDVPQCVIATEAINEKLRLLRDSKRQEAHAGTLRRPHRGATLLLRDANEGVVTDPNQNVTTTVAGLQFRFLAGNFFQNNPHVLDLMVQHVVDAATRTNRDGLHMTHLIDCYCGSGLFCLSASADFDTCVGIEVNNRAVEEARANAALNGRENCEFVAASAEAIFDSVETIGEGELVRNFPRNQTVVVVDPPRKGCSEEFLEQLYAFGPQRVVYMSCDPATQARDARGLVDHGYAITSVQPFDLFPQTRHIECLVVFERQVETNSPNY